MVAISMDPYRGSYPSHPETLPQTLVQAQGQNSTSAIIVLLVAFLEEISPGGLETAVQSALASPVGDQITAMYNITGAATFLLWANSLLTWIPTEDFNATAVYNVIVTFYFVFAQEPLASLQTAVVPSSAGKPLTWLSAWLVVFAQLVGFWMDTPDSITPASYQSFVDSPPYRMYEADVPEPDGFRTFNEFFSRTLLPGNRPVGDPDDPYALSYPADSTWAGAWDLGPDSVVVLKGLAWPVPDLLDGSPYADAFAGGIWGHTFLNTYNYHRQHAAVAGVVREARVIQGAVYTEVLVVDWPDGTDSILDAPDSPGYQFLQVRCLVIIESPTLGLVAILPVGMAQVSSVILSVEEGDVVERGQEISYFQFGGSDCVILVQKQSGLTTEDFPPPADTWSMVNSTLAKAPSLA